MERYDVVIIGAGPAGLNCAEKLASRGPKTLIIEQKEIIGPKVCAGGLTGDDLKYLGLPEELLDYRFNEITIHTPRQSRKVGLGKPFAYTVDRKNLGQWQLGKLKNTDVVIRTKTRVTKIGDDHVVVNGSEKIGFKYLVGADGSSSMVRRHVGLDIKKLLVAVQYILPTDKDEKYEMFLDSDLFNIGYAWIFPHRGYISVGCGCDPSFFPARKLKEGFDKWLKNKKLDIARGRYEAHPINYDYQGCKFNNIFLAGDAAGLASGLTGEGIYQALVSGEEVANMILDADHAPVKIEEILRKKKIHNRTLSILKKSGGFRKVEFELFVFLLQSGWFNKYAASMFV